MNLYILQWFSNYSYRWKTPLKISNLQFLEIPQTRIIDFDKNTNEKEWPKSNNSTVYQRGKSPLVQNRRDTKQWWNLGESYKYFIYNCRINQLKTYKNDEIQTKAFVNKAKRWMSKRWFRENKTQQVFQNTNISYPLRGAGNVLISEKLACFVSL